MRHSLINYPSVSIRKCTRCGAIKHINYLIEGKRREVWFKNNEMFLKAPECISYNNIYKDETLQI